MSSIRLPYILCAIATLSGLFATAAEAPTPPYFSLSAEQLGPAPLPWQAVRLRLTLKNISQKDLTKCWPLVEGGSHITHIKWPDSEQFGPVFVDEQRVPQYIDVRPRLDSRVTGYDRLAATNRYTLKAGESITVTTAILGGGGRPPIALFVYPGEHALLWSYWPGNEPELAIQAKPLTIKVGKPEKDDAVIAKLLAEHPKETRDFMVSLIRQEDPAEERTLRFLEQIIAKYPKSSYADYARLPVARHYAFGKLDEDGRRVLAEADAKRAISLLEAINMREFPYAPGALLLLQGLCDRDREKTENIGKGLLANHWDAIELIEAVTVDWQAEGAFEAMMKMRKGPPGKAKRD